MGSVLKIVNLEIFTMPLIRKYIEKTKISDHYEAVLEESPFVAVPADFDIFFFNRAEYFRETRGEKHLLFYLKGRDASAAEALARFTVFDGTAFSPLKAPFGAFEFGIHLPPEVLQGFIRHVTDTLKEREGLNRIVIKSYPVCYREAEALQMKDLLIREGFQITAEEVNQHIVISDQPLAERFHASEQRRLKKCLDAGFTFLEEEKPDVGELYALLKLSRERKKFPVSVTETRLREMLYDMPERYRTFTVRDEACLAAFAVGVIVNRDILYHFIPAHHPDYDTFSPACMLTEGIYRRCQIEKRKILDLGISSVNSRLNEGLYRFKRHLGAAASPKFSFEKVFSEQ